MLCVNRICTLVERETETYLKRDPDPFDERHPVRIDPKCALGSVLKAVFQDEELINRVVALIPSSRSSDDPLSPPSAITAARFLIDVLPALELSVVFQEDVGYLSPCCTYLYTYTYGYVCIPTRVFLAIRRCSMETAFVQETLIEHLLYWAERVDSHPLNVYSLVLLGAAAEFGEEHARQIEERTRALIPSVIQRLYELNLGLATAAAAAAAEHHAADEATTHSGSLSSLRACPACTWQ